MRTNKWCETTLQRPVYLKYSVTTPQSFNIIHGQSKVIKARPDTTRHDRTNGHASTSWFNVNKQARSAKPACEYPKHKQAQGKNESHLVFSKAWPGTTSTIGMGVTRWAKARARPGKLACKYKPAKDRQARQKHKLRFVRRWIVRKALRQGWKRNPLVSIR